MGLLGLRICVLDERGTIWDALIGAGIAVLGLGATLTGTVAVSHFAHQTIPAQAQLADLSNLVDATTRDAHSSIALFTPPLDVGNNDNSDGHELDFYTRGTKGNGHFWAYCFRAAATTCGSMQPSGSVARYHYGWSSLVQNGGRSGAVYDGGAIPNITSFAAQNVPASALLDPHVNSYSAAYLASAGITHITDVAQATGYPGVTAGNNVAILTVTNASGSRTVHLLSQQLAPARSVPVSTYTPAPNPFSMSAGTVAFRNPISPRQTVTLSEPNYGTRTTIPPQIYSLTATNCRRATTVSPGSPLTPADDGSGDAVVTITPVKRLSPGANCSMTFTDNAPQSNVVTVTVGSTYAPSISGPAAGFVRLGGASSVGVPFTFTESNYDVAANGGGITSIGATGSCSSASESNESMNGPDYSVTIRAVATSAGQCTITVTDSYGQTATSTTSVYGALKVRPDPISFANASAPAIGSVISDPGYSGAFTSRVTNCTNGAVAQGVQGSDNYHVTWYPLGPSGQCTWQVSDGSSVVKVPVTVGLGPLSVSPNPIAFANPASAPIQAVISDQGFTGTFSEQVTNCTNGTDATATAGADQFHVTWNAQSPGSCTWTVSDGVNTVSVPITVGASGPVGRLEVSLDNATWQSSITTQITAGQTVAVLARKTGSSDPIEVAPDTYCGFDYHGVNNVLGHPPTTQSWYAFEQIASLGGGGSLNANSTDPVGFNLTGGPGWTGVEENYLTNPPGVVVSGTDQCNLAVYDPVSGESAPVNVTVIQAVPPPPPLTPLVVGPILVSAGSTGPWYPAITLTWSTGNTADQWFYAYDPNNPANPNDVMLTPIGGSNCGNFAIGSASSGGAYDPASAMPGNWGYGAGQYASWASHVAGPFDGKDCTLAVSDSYGSETASITVRTQPSDPPVCPRNESGTPPNCGSTAPVTINALGMLHATCTTVPQPPIIAQDWTVICTVSGTVTIYDIPNGVRTDINGNTPIVVSSNVGGNPDFSSWGLPSQAGSGASATLYVNQSSGLTTMPFAINADGSGSLTYPGALPLNSHIWIVARYRWGPSKGGNPLDTDIEPISISATIGS